MFSSACENAFPKPSIDKVVSLPTDAPARSIKAGNVIKQVNVPVNGAPGTLDPTLLGKRKIDHVARGLSQKLGVIPVLRVGLAEAPGQGDHTAAFNIIEGLARLGFKGRVELVLKADDECEWGQMKEKLQLFLPEFNPGIEGVQTLRYSGLECECIPHKQLENYCKINGRPSEQPLGLWAMNGHRSWLLTKTAIIIPPFNWANTTPRIERDNEESQNLELPVLANYQNPYRPQKPMLTELLGRDPRVSGLENILRETEGERIHLLPVYGIHHQTLEPSHDVIIRKLISGAFGSHTSESEKTVVLVMSPLESLRRLQAEAELMAVPFYDLNKTKWEASAGTPVELLYCGPVPKPLFEWICCVADRPLVQEGANSAALMGLMGKPYLPLRPDGDTPLPELAAPLQKKVKKNNADLIEKSVALAERSKIELLGRSLTHDLQLYNYYSVAQDLCKKLRPLLSPMGFESLMPQFSSMIKMNHFDDAVFRPGLIDSIRYSSGSLSQAEEDWLKDLILANSFLPGVVPEDLKNKLVASGKALRKKDVNLQQLIVHRTSGLNMPGLRTQLSSLSLRRFEVSRSGNMACPIIVADTATSVDINELVGDICDSFSLLIPALFQVLKKDFSGDALLASFFEAGEGRDSTLDKIVDHLFYGDMTYDGEIRSLLKPKESSTDDLALFLRGDFGGSFFKQVCERMVSPENDSIRCGFRKLTRRDWSQILPGNASQKPDTSD